MEASDVVNKEEDHERNQPRTEGARSPKRLLVPKDRFHHIDELSPRRENAELHEVLQRVPQVHINSLPQQPVGEHRRCKNRRLATQESESQK